MSRGATVVCVVSGFGVGGGPHRVSINLQSTAEHQTGDVIRWQGLRAACCGCCLCRGHGARFRGHWGQEQSTQEGALLIISLKKNAGRPNLFTDESFKSNSQINPFLSTTWEHPLDIHVGPAAATPPAQHSPSLCRSFLVQSDVFITACTPPASQQMLCLYMAVSAQPRRRIPFKHLGGCHSDSRSSSCPTLVAQSVARLSVRFIYSTLWSVW